MDTTPSPNSATPRKRFWIWAGLCLVSVGLACLLGIASLFMLSRDARTLRDEMKGPSGGSSLRTKIQLSLGPLSTGLARLIVSNLDGVDNEARAALSAVRSVSVGVYEIDGDAPLGQGLGQLDERMKGRGWHRMVTVRERGDTVLIYAKSNLRYSRQIPLCLAVRDGRQLVIVSLKADPEPLMELAASELKNHPIRF